ncbi:MAG: hypothetical protein DI570_23385 [Phenylobacterium zucineum]|nr:MAG: hypothetical protein DI570_23385 [Phenylobacterium zucineum]
MRCPRPGGLKHKENPVFRQLCVPVAVALLAASPATAAVITSLPDGVKQAFPINNGNVTKPVTFGDGVTYKATTLTGVQTTSAFGRTTGFSFPDGSNWGGGEPFAAFGLQHGIMSFTFDDPVSAVLGEFIWARSANSEFTFRAFGVDGKLLESVTFTGLDPAHPKGFYGLQRSGNDIARFELQGYYFGVRNFSTLVAAPTAGVPEPATWALMIAGFGGAGAMLRRRRSAAFA